MDRGAWRATVHGSQRVGYDRATDTYFYYDYISYTSEHQAFDPSGWGPLT